MINSPRTILKNPPFGQLPWGGVASQAKATPTTTTTTMILVFSFHTFPVITPSGGILYQL